MLDAMELVEAPEPISVTQSNSFVTFLAESSPTVRAITRAVYLRTIAPLAASSRR
jgi:hypothetical protein